MGALSLRVRHRFQHAYRPKTWAMYKSMFLLFLAFCEFIQITVHPVSLEVMLFFVEFLAFNNLKAPSIMNYVTAIKSQYKWFHIEIHVFDHPRFKLFMKAVNISIRSPPLQKGIFDLQTLHNIITVSNSLPFSSVFKAIYLLAFFGFLRISNLAPNSKLSFDLTKHLCRGDFICHGSSAVLLIKWSKTLQTSQSGTFITLPNLGASPLCPIKALKNMITHSPLPPNFPMFLTSLGVVTQSQIRSHLTKVLSLLNLDHSHFTFHTFRRSGATLAFNNNVPIQQIKRQGTWSSDAVHAYIVPRSITFIVCLLHLPVFTSYLTTNYITHMKLSVWWSFYVSITSDKCRIWLTNRNNTAFLHLKGELD